MMMKFSYATFLALALTWQADAYLPLSFRFSRMSTTTLKMVEGYENEDFLKALSGGDTQSGGEVDEAETSQGGSRFKEILELAKSQRQSEPAFTGVMNPFIEPPAPPAPTNLGELSVEEQARMFREMMQNGGVAPSRSAGADLPPPPRRVARTDRAGRPVGRNRDADMIANTADLYFAQLKRDSSVRSIARIYGDEEESEAVFQDDGIKELEGILVKNPYLQDMRDQEQNLIDTIPEEFVKPYLDLVELDDENLGSSGISYKEKLNQRRQKLSGSQVAVTPQTVASPASREEAPQMQFSAPEPIVAAATPLPPPFAQITQQSPIPTAPPQPVSSSPPFTTTSNAEDTKRKMRTLMGLLLKHRGGPGFGKGRLTGREIDQFDNLLQEVTELLREEALQPGGTMMGGTSPLTQPGVPQISVERPPLPTAVLADRPQMDSFIACIEGATTMYKNSPPELKSSVLVMLRAALASAINACDGILGANDPTPFPASAHFEGTLAVIEGAVSMYRNSPAELRNTVLVTLRAALKSAVSTCDAMVCTPSAPGAVGYVAQVTQPPVQPVVPTMPAPVAPSTIARVDTQSTVRVVSQTDPNSKSLNEIYRNLKNAGGEGSLGLRSDLTSEEASKLADQLVEMRRILMRELETGIPDPEPESTDGAAESADGSTVSNYQQMLAKARAEKAAQ